MKKPIILLALVSASMLLTASLAACTPESPPLPVTTEAATEAPTEAAPIPSGTPCTDYDWVTFDIPEGFSDTHNWDTFAELRSDSSSATTITVQQSSLDGRADVQAVAQENAEHDGYSMGDEFDLGKYHWTTVNYTVGSKPSAYYYTPSPDGVHFVYVCARCVTVEDDPVKCVLNSIEIK